MFSCICLINKTPEEILSCGCLKLIMCNAALGVLKIYIRGCRQQCVVEPVTKGE